jgi:outer membrane receptor protein involved in Fe transport
MVRSGTDYNTEFRDRRRAYSTQRFQRGSYREEKIVNQESNTDFLLSAVKDFTPDFSFSASLGGNLRTETSNQSDIAAPELAVPGTYSLNNSRVALTAFSERSEKRVNSLYAFTQLGYKNMAFLELTARNDWSSTLPSNNWSYFYPGANLSVIVSDLLKIDSGPLSFLKARIGIASVGNDTKAFSLVNTYVAQTNPVKGSPSFSESAILANGGLLPEISATFETGFESRFFNDRIGLDFTYYSTNTENQILPIPLSNTTG